MLNDYIASVDTIELLTWEEEQKLWKAYEEQGDLEARMTIIEHYQPLVLKEANVYQSSKIDMMDCIQEGTIGLIEAVERYDPSRGVAFSLYAVHRIRGRILDFLRCEGQVDLPCLEVETETHETAKDLLVDVCPSVAELAEHHALVGVLGAAMERLPARERLVLEGVTIGGARAQTMAEALGVTSAQIYRLQKNGIRRIRGMLSRFMHHWQN